MIFLEQKVALQYRKAEGAHSGSRIRAAALTSLWREVDKLPTSIFTDESSLFFFFHAFFISNSAVWLRKVFPELSFFMSWDIIQICIETEGSFIKEVSNVWPKLLAICRTAAVNWWCLKDTGLLTHISPSMYTTPSVFLFASETLSTPSTEVTTDACFKTHSDFWCLTK